MPDSAAQELERHRAWLEGGRDGERPSLAGAVFRDADLRGIRLTEADLRGAALAGADLADADLEGADLEGADMQGASLAGANLRRCRLVGSHLRDVRGLATATLRDADLHGVTGLSGTEFAGADLAGARLPETLSFQPRLDYIAQTSQNARPAFLSIMLSCVFIVLTVFSTPDSALLSNASLAVLPDLATNIPAASFFWVAPILLLSLYVYMHLQMYGIGETRADLPAVFPDGTPLEKRAYPWVATNLLRMRSGWGGGTALRGGGDDLPAVGNGAVDVAGDLAALPAAARLAGEQHARGSDRRLRLGRDPAVRADGVALLRWRRWCAPWAGGAGRARRAAVDGDGSGRILSTVV